MKILDWIWTFHLNWFGSFPQSRSPYHENTLSGLQKCLRNIELTNSKCTHFPLKKNPLTFLETISLPLSPVLSFEYPLSIPTLNPKVSKRIITLGWRLRRFYENLTKRLFPAQFLHLLTPMSKIFMQRKAL